MATKKSNAQSSAKEQNLKNARIVVGNIATREAPGVKTSGIETRGNGAATKGRIARGPMA
jgi:ribosomal protein L22